MTKIEEIFPTLDPIAFVGALILAPLLVAVLFFWLLLIPVVALAFGAVPYLLFATPVLAWMVTRYPVAQGLFAVGGLLAHFAFCICLAIWSNAQSVAQVEMTAFMALWGVPFSAAWCAAFASLYVRFYRLFTHNPCSERNA